MDLRLSDYVFVYVYLEKDIDWVIEDDSQFLLCYFGFVGFFLVFFVIKYSVFILDFFLFFIVICNWEISGFVGLFVSLVGFFLFIGEFVLICDGIYFVVVNICVQVRFGLYKLYLFVNGERFGFFYDENVVFFDSIFIMNFYGLFYLKVGDILVFMIKVLSLDERLIIYLNSDFFVSFVDVFNQSLF